jgi:Transcriptional regulatory protein, C terminal
MTAMSDLPDLFDYDAELRLHNELFRAAARVGSRDLGSVGVSDGDRLVGMHAAKQRALLAILLLNANKPVATDRLIDQLWDGRPPATARKVLQTYVSKLRRLRAMRLGRQHGTPRWPSPVVWAHAGTPTGLSVAGMVS